MNAEPLALLHQLAAESRQAGRRRSAGGKNSARGGGVRPRMGERDRAQTELVKNVQQWRSSPSGSAPSMVSSNPMRPSSRAC